MARKSRPITNDNENAMVRSLDALASYEEYTSEVLPLLRRAISEGWTAERIEQHPKIKAALVARQLSIALKDPNVGTALAAIKDARDRTGGKSIERRDLRVSLESASDEDIDAKLKELMAGSTISMDEFSELESDEAH